MARTARRYETKQPVYEDEDTGRREGAECLDGREICSVGIYSRLSVDHNDRKAESIENQIEIIRQYIAEENRRIKNGRKFAVQGIYIDRGTSGTSFQREGFGRLMDDVRSHKIDCIIVKDLSRFGRDYVETGNYIEKILPFLGVRFIAVTDGFDSMAEDAGERKLTMNIKNLVNDMYAKDISERVGTARKLATESGGYTGSTPPYGYRAVRTDGVRRLAVDEESAQVVRFLYESIAGGISPNQLAVILYGLKIHRISDYKQSGHVFCTGEEVLRQWTPGAIRGVLSNPVYTGKLVHGRKKPLSQEEQAGSGHPDRGEKITVHNSHEPVVGGELFDRVNRMLERGKRHDAGKRPPGDDENIFRNVLCCGKCKRKMHAVSYKGRTDGGRSYAYECRGAYYIDGRKCEKNYIREETLEVHVAELIRQALKEQGITSRNLAAWNRKEYENAIASYQDEIDRLCRENKRFAARAGEMYRGYKEGNITDAEYSVFRESRAEYDRFREKRTKELRRKIRKSEIRMEDENKFLRSLLRRVDSIKLNVQAVDSLICRIDVFPQGKLEIWFRFGKGGGCHREE